MNKKPTKINLTSDDSLFEKSLNLQKYIEDLSSQAINLTDKFSFSWAGKSNAIKSILVPSKLTLNPEPKQSIKWDDSENLFIEGDNLEVLKLLQKAYFEKVKMIYIDPPYNTGHDFVYNDDFSSPLDSYLKQTGQKTNSGESATTNKETNGRYHSDWLSMMYPRIKLAWNLLREDGVIFVSIDDNEVHHLRMVMDEVFGEENFMGQMVWHARGRSKTPLSIDHEYILCYSKDIKNIVSIFDPKNKVPTWYGQPIERKYANPDNDKRGEWRDAQHTVTETKAHYTYSINSKTGEIISDEVKNDLTWYGHQTWMYPEHTISDLFNDNRLVFSEYDGHLALKVKKFKTEEVPYSALEGLIQRDIVSSRNGTEELLSIFDGKNYFDYPKPTAVLKRLIQAATTKDDIVLDFFSGSGTTAHAVMSLNQLDKSNRRFILVQLPETLNKNNKDQVKAYNFLQDLGKPSNIAELAKERISRVIRGYGENPQPIDSGFKVFTLSESNYPENNFVLDPEKSQEENQKAFIDYLNKAKQSQLFDKENDMSLVYENIVKEGLSLNSKVEKVSIGKNNVYRVTDGEQQLLICLENKLASETVKELTDKSHKGKLFICLESSLDDTTAANLSLNLDLKTI